jgi:hypothetical protein
VKSTQLETALACEDSLSLSHASTPWEGGECRQRPSLFSGPAVSSPSRRPSSEEVLRICAGEEGLLGGEGRAL